MDNIQKSIGVLISSFFLIFDAGAMQHQEGLKHEIGSKCCYEVTKYPNFGGAVKLIDIEVSYKGRKSQIGNIYIYLNTISRNKGLSMYNIAKSLEETFKKIPTDISVEVARQCYEDVEQRYLENLLNKKSS